MGTNLLKITSYVQKIEITLNNNYVSLKDDEEDEENNKLNYSSKVLGK
jgi:hypothetical protein